MKTILPVIDTEILQQKANEFAMKGATETLRDFYSGYSSPYRKAIEEDLKTKGIAGYKFELPDIVASINDQLTQEIDVIANRAISKTFIPLVNKILTRTAEKVQFSEILKEFIESVNFDKDDDDWEDFSASVEESDYGWLDVKISGKDSNYSLHISDDNEYKQDLSKRYSISSLPWNYEGGATQTMKLSLDGGATLEMPFTKNVLNNSFVSFIAQLVMSKSEIVFDTKSFDDEMFGFDEYGN